MSKGKPYKPTFSLPDVLRASFVTLSNAITGKAKLIIRPYRVFVGSE